jgi:hypothetical protein
MHLENLRPIIFALMIWRHHLYGAHIDLFGNHKSFKYLFDQKDLNMRQRRWMEYMEDFDFSLKYHPGKANVVAGALCRKALHVWELMMHKCSFFESFTNLNVNMMDVEGGLLMNKLKICYDLGDKIVLLVWNWWLFVRPSPYHVVHMISLILVDFTISMELPSCHGFTFAGSDKIINVHMVLIFFSDT